MDKLYMDDTFGVLRQNAEKNAHVKHTTCLAAVGPRLKFTCEIEENKEYRSYHWPQLQQRTIDLDWGFQRCLGPCILHLLYSVSPLQQKQQQQQCKKRLAFVSIPYVATIDKKLKHAFLSNDVDYHT